jgi:glucose/arabinose dehydrogenase
VIFQGEESTGRGHSGGRMVFLADGTLLLGVGHQIGDDQAAQRKADTLGSVVRIAADGGIPADNPFVGQPDARPEIYSWGNRNPQGLAVRPGTQQVWEVEHGPMGGDELNLLVRGANYGWPLATFGREYDGSRIGDRRHDGTLAPVWFWAPSIAPGALAFYDGTAFPEWRGDLFVTALKSRRLERFEMDGDHVIGREILLEGIGHRVRDIVIGPDGFIYLALDSPAGRIIRLEPVPKAPVESQP